MKIILMSVVLAGAGGFVVHANETNCDVAPDSFKKLDTIQIERDTKTFIKAPHPQCIIPGGILNMNSVIGDCLNVQRKWVKAI